MKTILKQAMIVIVVMTIGTLMYTGVTTVIAQIAFHNQANGSLIENHGVTTGSKLVADGTMQANRFIGRPIGATNLSQTSSKEAALVAKRVTEIQKLDPNNHQSIPVDLVTASASGTDPYISMAAAQYQVKRLAAANHVSTSTIEHVINISKTSSIANLLGTPAVNVMIANQELTRLDK